MGRRVGVTTNPFARKAEWEGIYKNVRNWWVSRPYSSREKAQDAEKRIADIYGFEFSPESKEPVYSTSKWYVYRFEHSGQL